MKRTIVSIILLSLLPCLAMAYDFVADGIYYTITDRHQRTVEVTHWEELTGDGGKPVRLYHDQCCSTHDHHDGHMTRKHRLLALLDEAAEERERTAYIGEVVIPSEVRYRGIRYRVTGIGDGSFFGRKQLTAVTLPPTITYIGRAAFENCTALTHIVLPDAVRHLRFAAFRRCLNLTELTLPDSVQTIDMYAFAFCEHLTQFRLPESVSTFPGNAFFHCVRLQRISLPHLVPPVVNNEEGLIMNFRGILFCVPEAALPRYREDAFWSKQQLTINQ